MGGSKVANYKYSFSNPMRAYKSYTKPLDESEIREFVNKYGKRLSFKQANFWMASKGINKSDIKPDDIAFYVSDALGRSYGFPYKYQNELIKALDTSDTANLLNSVNTGKQVGAFDWKSFTTSSALVGYILNMIKPISITREWTDDVFETYMLLNQKILSGQVVAVFMPYYLAPKSYRNFIKHSLLATKGVFNIGAAVLYDNTMNNALPCAFIPDVDFITQFDLTPFSALGLGQMYKDYVSLLQTNESFASKHMRCDSPKPASVIEKGVKEEIVNEVKVEEKKPEVKDNIEFQKKIYNKAKTCITPSPFYIIDSQKVEPLAGNGCVLSCVLTNLSPSAKEIIPSSVIDYLQAKNGVSTFKAKDRQKVYLNIFFKEKDGQCNITTNLGLYGLSEVGIQIGNCDVSESYLIDDSDSGLAFLRTILGDEMRKSLFEDLGASFEESIFKGLYQNKDKMITNYGLDESKFNFDNVKIDESENEYNMTFGEGNVYKSLKITGNEKNSNLRYDLKMDAGLFGYEPDEVSVTYSGSEEISSVIDSLVRGVLESFK